MLDILEVEAGVTSNALIRRLALDESDIEVVLGGSLFKGKGNLLIDTIQRESHACARGAQAWLPHYEPVIGAALLALEAIGVEIDREVGAAVERTFPRRLFNNKNE